MDRRFLQEEGKGLFTGNELIVKGALENRVAAITGYPGSPLAELFETLGNIKELLTRHGTVAQIANNEALAAARLNGAQMEKIRAMAVMKNVGMHVAADGLALGNMTGAHPQAGAVLVVGDDTWSEGTQVPADSRFLARHLYMPVLEPATFQELKDWVGAAFELSAHSSFYITYLVTSNQADGGATVQVGPNAFASLNAGTGLRLDTRTIAANERVVIPPTTAAKERELYAHRLPRLHEKARSLGLDRLIAGIAQERLGFVAAGMSYCYLQHALHLLGLAGRFPILKLGLSYPLDTEAVLELAGRVDHLCVVEEKRSFVEEQIGVALATRGNSARLWGKRFPGGRPGFPNAGGLNPSLVEAGLGRLLDSLELAHPVPRPAEANTTTPSVVPRPPSFCPGCPHRDSASVLDRAAEDLNDPAYARRLGTDPTDLVFHGDIGCYSMLKYAPFSRLMHNLSGMGLGGGTGAGIDPFIDNKQVVFMGDSTFFHSGMAAISDSIKNAQDITYIILDNKTTAMTGHQPTPGADSDLMGNPTFAQDIERIVRGMAGEDGALVARMDPSRRRAYRRLLEKTLVQPGVKVVIADKECGITFHRRQRALQAAAMPKQGFIPVERHIHIDEEVCENCLECARGTGCSGLGVTNSSHGPKLSIDRSACVADGACTRVEVGDGDKTCPSFAEVTVRRRRPSPTRRSSIDVGHLPLPEQPPLDGPWYAYIAGVGGMGINLVSSALAQAGARQGYEVRLTNKKGLAIRNGSVYSHISFAPAGLCLSPLTPAGGAHLLLGLDALEAARACDPQNPARPASSSRTAAAINTAMTPTIPHLIGDEPIDPVAQVETVRRGTDPERFCGADLTRLCQDNLGNKLYANTMLLGLAFQRGLLPLSLENLQEGLAAAVPRNAETNALAFAIGRRLAVDPAFLAPQTAPHPEPTAFIAQRTALLRRARGKRQSTLYRELAEHSLESMPLPATDAVRLCHWLYDLCQYEDAAYARVYARTVRAVFERDTATYGREATRAALEGLGRAMAIKDEVYVAHLLTCEEKRLRDARTFAVDCARGDRIEYRFFTRPHVRLFGRDFRPDIRARRWQLRLVARARFLRRLFASWWHREEAEFRDWYVDLVAHFDYADAREYRAWVQVLRLPEHISGYRGVRAPKMAAARRRAGELLEGRPPPLAPGTVPIVPADSPDC